MSIFQAQGYITLKLETNLDVSSASDTRILYKKPDGSRGYWTADSIENDTILVYDMTNEDLDQAGVWTFQAFATLDGRNAYGEYVQKEIKPFVYDVTL